VSRNAQLGDVCTIVPGGRSKLTGNDFTPSGFPAFGAGGLNGYLPNAEFSDPAVVLSSIGARCGKCFLAEGEWASLANTQLIFPDPDQVDVRFLWYQLDDELAWHRSGTAQPFIKTSDVRSRRIFLPPIEEQRRIAAMLDSAAALGDKRRHALEVLRGLPEALLREVLDSQVPTPAVRPLGEMAAFVGGVTFKPSDVRHVRTKGTVAVFRTSNVQTELDLADLWYVDGGLVKRRDQLVRPYDSLI